MAIYDGGSNDDSFFGGSEDDYLAGWGGNDTLEGGGGQDLVRFSGAFSEYTITQDAVTGWYTVADSMFWRDGTDQVRNVEWFWFSDVTRAAGELLPGPSGIYGTEGSDTLYGSIADDTVYGLGGHDSILAGDGNDILEGGADDDFLAGEAGNDTLDGGDGVADMAYFRGALADYDVTYDPGTGDAFLSDRVAGRDGTDTIRNIETFAFADGPRTLGEVVPAAGPVNVITGSSWGDWLQGGPGRDHIQGLEGGDNLEGREANDVLEGGDGDDTLFGGMGDDQLEGGAGQNDAAVYMGVFADYDISYDSASNRYAIAHRMGGADGVDTVRDVERFYFADGAKSAWELVPAPHPTGIEVYGTGGNDQLGGTPHPDSLWGLDGHDRLEGFAGNDYINGGPGGDILVGGAGGDAFVVTGGANGSIDLILDFTAGEDHLSLEHYSFPGLAVGYLEEIAFQGAATPDALTADVRIVFDTNTGGVYYDADGAGGLASTQIAHLDLAGLVGIPSAGDIYVNF